MTSSEPKASDPTPTPRPATTPADTPGTPVEGPDGLVTEHGITHTRPEHVPIERRARWIRAHGASTEGG